VHYFVVRAGFTAIVNRRAALLGLLAVLMCTAGCVRSVKVPVVLRTEPPLTVGDLVARVNRLAEVERIQATVSLQFRDLGDARRGKNKEYPAADGILVLARPEMIRLRIKAPFVGKTISDMVSDGTTFRVKVLYPDDKRQYIIGSNAGRYKRVEAGMETDDPALQQAGSLANIRPQHLTGAFLMRPIQLDTPDGVYFLDEARQVERAPRGTKKADEVIRIYYVLTLLERVGTGPEARVLRRLWFDRTRSGTPLARQELYEDGHMATLIFYGNYVPIANGLVWPERVTIERVADNYSVEVIFEPQAVTINGEVPEEAFQLPNEENLPEIDLDKRPEVLAPRGSAAP
jgi:hypothetical protein